MLKSAWIGRIILLVGWCLMASSANAMPDGSELTKMKALFKRPLAIPFPATAPYSPQLATLGKKLFFDPRLSGAKNINCASCHNPSFGFEAPVDRAVGAANTPLGRHAPTTLNMAWVKPLFWDGRSATLEEQAAGPITAPTEMNGKFPVILEELRQIEEYKKWFARLFPGSGVTRANILTAIATYERTIVTSWAPFDRWVDGQYIRRVGSLARPWKSRLHCQKSNDWG